MPYKMNAQSFARMRNQQSVHKRAKDARWRSRKVGARTRRPKRPQTQGCVIVLAQSFARYETNRASTTCKDARWRSHKVAARCSDPNDRNSTPRPTSTTTNRHNPAFFGAAGGRTRNLRVVQGCTKAVAQSRYARMHKDSHTKPLHDATAQMAVDAQMQRHKWLSMHRCGNPNG